MCHDIYIYVYIYIEGYSVGDANQVRFEIAHRKLYVSQWGALPRVPSLLRGSTDGTPSAAGVSDMRKRLASFLAHTRKDANAFASITSHAHSRLYNKSVRGRYSINTAINSTSMQC